MVALFIALRPTLKLRGILLAILAQGLLCSTAQTADWSLTPLNPGGIYEAGEQAGWAVKPLASATGTYRYELRQNNLQVVQDGTLEAGAAGVIGFRSAEPGMLFLEIKGSAPQVAGLAVNPRDIAPSLPAPRDFDRFWKSRIKQAQRVLLDAELKPGSSDRTAWNISRCA